MEESNLPDLGLEQRGINSKFKFITLELKEKEKIFFKGIKFQAKVTLKFVLYQPLLAKNLFYITKFSKLIYVCI